MLAPESMLQLPAPVTDMRGYFVILPDGTYTSGTYTIPGGYQWDDFKLLVAVLGRNSVRMAGVWLPDEAFGNAGWVKDISPNSDGTNLSRIEWVSATEFKVSRNSSGAVRMLAGYLK
jgi:hypothetical protein